MHRIPAQQACALFEIVFHLGGANHNGAEAKLLPTAGLFDEEPRRQPANAPEAVEHHVLGLADGRRMAANDLSAGPAHEGFRVNAGLRRFRHKLGGQLAHVDVARAEVEGRHGFEDGVGLELRQLVALHLPHIAMGLHDAGDALVVERPAVAVGHHVAAIELTDDRDHGLREGLPLLPIGEIIIKAR